MSKFWYLFLVIFYIDKDDDVVDEAIRLFRANVLFRNFEVQGGGDRILVYLTLFIHQVRIENLQVYIFTFFSFIYIYRLQLPLFIGILFFFLLLFSIFLLIVFKES